MGRQQRNRHPANRLGQRRRPRSTDPVPAGGEAQRSGPDPRVQGEEPLTHHRPAGQNSPHQS
jgi:hypothetical protein